MAVPRLVYLNHLLLTASSAATLGKKSSKVLPWQKCMGEMGAFSAPSSLNWNSWDARLSLPKGLFEQRDFREFKSQLKPR
jgi:hypothetical protein